MIRLYHLYPDLMDLYGDYANLLILSRALARAGFENEIVKRSLIDRFDLSDAGFVYIGSGRESRQKRAMAHLLKNRETFAAAFERGVPILLTGNAMEMIGKSVTDREGEKHEGLALASFETYEGDKRLVSDEIVSLGDEKLVGFVNKASEIRNVDSPLFRVEFGLGNAGEEKSEGYTAKNLFATHLIGPILVKNPAFLARMVRLAAGGKPVDAGAIRDKYADEAYAITLAELSKRAETESKSNI